jgi:hypothetical protein
MESIVATSVPPDAVEFDPSTARVEPIRMDDETAGARVMLPARCGSARLPLQIDIGVGDAIWPPPTRSRYPTLLGFPALELLAYPREAVFAEKFEAMVVLGDRNSRIKDYFDLHHLARHYEFDRATHSEAVKRTFSRRRTPVPLEDPIGLTSLYWENPSRPCQIRAFARRARVDISAVPESDLMGVLRAFLVPILEDLRIGICPAGRWNPGGPWR